MMPRYRDDQCAQCGGIRVAKSTLCADCLAALCSMEGERRMEMLEEIKLLKGQIARDNKRLDDALAYGFKKNQENAKLLQMCKRLQGIALRRGNDEKDGVLKN